MPTLEIDLFDYAKGVEQLEKYYDSFNKAIDDGIAEVVVRLEKRLKQYITEYDIPESIGTTINSIKVDNGFMIVINSEIGMFFEYGTGIVGSENPHPLVPAGWTYDVNQHGEMGWWYPTTESDPNPYKWVDGSGQLRGWTKGKPSMPYMHKTYLYGRRIIKRTLNKHLKKVKLK